MAKDAKKHQKKLQKQSAKRKKKRTLSSQRSALMATPALSRVKSWPLEEAWISEGWRRPDDLIQAIFSRRSPNGHLAFGGVMVDPKCLGVKDAYGRVDTYETYRMILGGMKSVQTLVETDIDVIAKVIRDSIQYARTLGIEPHKELRDALMVLGKANPDSVPGEMGFGGPEGKPLYIAGPRDNVNQILKTLRRTVGQEGFDYVLPLEMIDDMKLDDINLSRAKIIEVEGEQDA
ncbi:MAG: hypothetical protein AAF639_06350 [Chloroflexota bacterium]